MIYYNLIVEGDDTTPNGNRLCRRCLEHVRGDAVVIRKKQKPYSFSDAEYFLHPQCAVMFAEDIDLVARMLMEK